MEGEFVGPLIKLLEAGHERTQAMAALAATGNDGIKAAALLKTQSVQASTDDKGGGGLTVGSLILEELR